MSQLLLEWLNTSLVLNEHITSIREQFSNGYLFGEVLFKLQLITELEFTTNFINSNEHDEIILNFSQLKSFLDLTLQLFLSEKQILQIINRDISSAASLLYRIKTSNDQKKINFRNITTHNPSNTKANEDEMKKKFLRLIDSECDATASIVNNNRYDDDTCSIKDNSTQDIKRQSKIKHILQSTNLEVINDDNAVHYSNNNSVYDNNNNTATTPMMKKVHVSRSQIISLPKTYNNINGGNNSNSTAQFEVGVFNESLRRIGLDINIGKLNMLNGQLNFDMSQDVVMLKLKEQLRDRMTNKMKEHAMKSKRIRNELDICQQQQQQRKNIVPLNEINFLKRDKNPLLPRNDFNPYAKHNYKSQQFERRLKYENNYKQAKLQKTIQQRVNFFRSLILKPSNNNNNNKMDMTIKKDIFSKSSFFSALDKLPLQQSVLLSNQKLTRRNEDYPLIKAITYQIIDMAFEGYLYQLQYGEDLLELDEYKRWNKLFVNNLPLREASEDEETKRIKEANKVIETPVIDYNSIIEFNDIDNINFMNYVNYAGMWNERKVIEQQHEQHDQSQYESTNDKIDYKDIVDNYDDTFEPTEEEMEDAVVQKVPCKNYLLSRLVEHVVDEKIKMESKKDSNSVNTVNIVNKWNHIPFKMCVMGCPLVGKKTLVKEIKEKYKGIKVYSVMSIVDEYINEWNEINTPVESLAKYKTMKKPQIDAYIEEQKQKIEQFKDKYQLIQPFILPPTTTTITDNNTNNNDNSNKSSSLSKDEALLQILITKIETDFPIQSEQDSISQIIQRQQTLSGLEDKLKVLIEQNTLSKKPKTKDEQTIKKEIETIESSIYSGFILLDFPSTYNQCLLLEHYLTNYVDILSQPKQYKHIILDALSNTVDLRITKPITTTTVQKGFDFVFALTSTPDDIERRYQSVKYDPQTKTVYNDIDISNGKVDKNIISRLQVYPRDVFDQRKSEFDNNYIAINNLYSSFGNIHEIQSTGSATTQSILEHIESKYLYPQYQMILNKEKEIYANNTNNNVNNTESQDITRSIIATGTIHNNNNIGHSNTKHKTLSMIKMYTLNTDNVISLYTLINTFNDKYISHSKYLLHLLTSQTTQIIERLELIQKKFNQFLNKPTKKKELLSLYKTKYNSFYKEHYALLSNPQVHEMFLTDIHSLNDQLWSFAQEKQFDSINELHTIQTSGYIENELYKLYITVLELFNTESERYITSCDFIVQYFINSNNNNTSNSNQLDIRSLHDTITSLKPKHQLHETPFPNKNSTASSLYKTNIHLTYLNMFNLLFKTNAYVKDVESKIISLPNINISSQVNANMNESVIGQKRKLRKKNSMLFGDSNVSHIFGGNSRGSIIDDMKNGIRVEKRKMKIRAALIKAFAFKEIDKIVQVSNDVFHSMDEWIIQSVTKQNERINEVIYELECHLNEKTLIKSNSSSSDNEEHVVDPVDQIEFDDFSKENNFYKWINVEDKFIYNTYDKVLPLFDYDVECLYKIIKRVKGYECAKNVLVKRVFDELVVKRYLCGRDDNNDQHDDDNNNNNNNNNTHTHTHVLTDINNTTTRQVVNGIPLAFQEMIDFSKYSKLYDLYKVEGDNKASDNSNDSDSDSNKEQFVNYSEVFTLICIAGLMVPSEDEVKEMVECSKKVIVNGHYMKKEDFLSMHLWYEPTIVIENSDNDDIKDNNRLDSNCNSNNNEQQQQQETKMSKQNSMSSIKDGNSNSNNKLSNQQSVASVQSKKLSKQKSTESIKGKGDSSNSNTNTNNNKLSKQQSLTSVHDVKKEDNATNAGGGSGGETSRKEIKEFIPSTIKELLFCIWKLDQPKEHSNNTNNEDLMNFTHFISVINPQRYVPLPDTYENYFDIVFPKQQLSSNNIINLNDSNSNNNELINN